MSRSRNIKPALFENELLGQMDGDTVLTFIGLWCMADRAGRLEDRPLRLKAKLFPYREVSIENSLSQLEECGFLIRYKVEEKAFIQIVNFLKHQHPHHAEQASEIPPAPDNLRTKEGRSTDLAPTKVSRCPSDSLIPHTDPLILIPSKGASPDGEQEVVVKQQIAKSSKPRKVKPESDDDPDFKKFWDVYPLKMAKPRAFKAWSKAKLPAIADILAAVEAQASSEKWQKEGGKYIPYPATWINEERWNDQLPKPQTIPEHADF